MSNLQTYYRLKLDFQKVDQHRGGKWLSMYQLWLIYSIWISKPPHETVDNILTLTTTINYFFPALEGGGGS